MTPPPTLARSFSWVVASRLGAAALQAAVIAFLARATTLQEFGTTAAVLGALTLVTVVGDLGTTVRLITVQASGAGDALTVARLVRLNALLTGTAGILTSIVLLTLARTTGSPALAALAPLGLWVSLERACEVRTAVAMGRFDQKVAATCLLLRRGVTLTVMVVPLLALDLLTGTARTGRPGGLSPVLLFALANTLGSLAGWVHIRRRVAVRGVGAPLATLLAELRHSIPFLGNSLGAQLRNLDTAVVSWTCGPTVAGVFGLPSRMISPLRIVPTSLATALLPHVSATRGRRPTGIARTLLATLLVTNAFYGVLFLLADRLVEAFAGPAFSAAVTPLRILLVGLAFAGLSASLTSLLQGQGHERGVARVSLASGTGTLVLLAALAGPWGAVGAATAASCGYVGQCLALGLLLTSRRPYHSTEVPPDGTDVHDLPPVPPRGTAQDGHGPAPRRGAQRTELVPERRGPGGQPG